MLVILLSLFAVSARATTPFALDQPSGESRVFACASHLELKFDDVLAAKVLRIGPSLRQHVPDFMAKYGVLIMEYRTAAGRTVAIRPTRRATFRGHDDTSTTILADQIRVLDLGSPVYRAFLADSVEVGQVDLKYRVHRGPDERGLNWREETRAGSVLRIGTERFVVVKIIDSVLKRPDLEGPVPRTYLLARLNPRLEVKTRSRLEPLEAYRSDQLFRGSWIRQPPQYIGQAGVEVREVAGSIGGDHVDLEFLRWTDWITPPPETVPSFEMSGFRPSLSK